MILKDLYRENGWNTLKYNLNDGISYPIEKKQKILAVINPHSGSGKAIKVFKTVVEPEWKKQGIDYQILITEHADHSTELISHDNSIQRFNNIIAIGGDGTLAEIIKGLERNKLINQRRSIKLGIIPVGSGNGLFKSLKPELDKNNKLQIAAKIAAFTASKAMDLIKVTQNQEQKTAFLAITLGLIADTDILSEPFRFMGSLRFTLGALWCLWKNKEYHVDLSFLLNENDPSNSQDWSKISGKFSLLMIGNTSHCSADAHTSPGARIDDGYMHVSAVKTASIWTKFKLLLGLESGSWVQHPSVIRFKTKALRIDSISHDAIVTLDGEKIQTFPLECRIQPKALQILCS